MGLVDKIRRYEEERLVYRLPDGEVIRLRPVPTMDVLVRLGAVPAGLTGLFQRTRGATDLTPEEIQATALLEEAKWAFGIVEPRLCMGTQPDCEGIPVRVFQAYLRDTYGERVVQDIMRRIQEISGELRAEEVHQDERSFQGVAEDAPLPGEDIRDEPDRAPAPPHGGV